MMSAPAFREWLASAALGDEMVWHVGDITSDSDPSRAGLGVRALNALLDEVLAAKKDGRVKLRQEPLPANGSHQHIARRIS